LFDQGLDKIEVSDFGCGVPRDSRYLLAMKHATSKIRSFDDIYADKQDDGGEMQMQQLGFRGEALFSLANISQQLVISTRTENEEIGQSMAFRRDGYPDLSATTDVARKVGTTVAVVKLFGALPVRRADLIKRIKFHRAKMLRLLQACKFKEIMVPSSKFYFEASL
jgi:DNA mismatch repair protein PMS2